MQSRRGKGAFILTCGTAGWKKHWPGRGLWRNQKVRDCRNCGLPSEAWQAAPMDIFTIGNQPFGNQQLAN
jgi:hypothetical protein